MVQTPEHGSGVVRRLSPLMQTCSGGTRDVDPKRFRNRPWQVQFKYPVVDCPLCKPQMNEVVSADGQWRSFGNKYTPYPGVHRVHVPMICTTSDEQLRRIDSEAIERSWRFAFAEAKQLTMKGPWAYYTHRGYFAGQNQPHEHWHLCELPGNGSIERLDFDRYPLADEVIYDRAPNFVTAAWGYRTGSMLIAANEKKFHWPTIFEFGEAFEELVQLTTNVVQRCYDRFNAPDFKLGFYIGRISDGWSNFVLYEPILTHLGGSESAAAILGTAYVLATPHETIARYLTTGE